MEKSGMYEKEADNAWNNIADHIDRNIEIMNEVFGAEFEKRLPDVEIVDRNYYYGFLDAS